MNNKIIEVSLFLCTLLSSLYGGTGFFMAMGGNPAIRRMSDNTFVEYWQHTDHYMAARMRIFGPILLAVILLTVILLVREYRTASFWIMIAALGVIITDIAFTLSVNHPLNQLIQSWDLQHLPSQVQEIKEKVAQAFDTRKLFMMGAFGLILLAAWLRKPA